MNSPTDVAVVGGGIGGLTAALLFARHGATVTILERIREPREVGAGLLLQPNGLAVLDGLSLAGEIEALGYRTTGAPVKRADGRTILDVRFPKFGAGLDHALAVRRSRLFATLLDAVQESPSITAHFGAVVTAVRRTGELNAQTRSGQTSLRAGIVVGADGAHSVVRRCGDFAAKVWDTQTRYVRGIVDSEDLGLEGEYWSGLGLFGGAPLGDGTTYFYAAAHDAHIATALESKDLARLRERWAGALPIAARILHRVRSIDDLLVNDVVRVDCGRWVDGQVVLLGDAAHAMAPTLGQGANSAIVDAAVLVAELAGARSSAEGLAGYVARRQVAVRKVQDAADRLTRLSRMRGRIPVAARDRLLRLLGASPTLSMRQAHLAQQVDPADLRAGVLSLAAAPRE